MGSATHILTAHHSSPPVVGWIINPISKRYMGLLMSDLPLLQPNHVLPPPTPFAITLVPKQFQSQL